MRWISPTGVAAVRALTLGGALLVAGCGGSSAPGSAGNETPAATPSGPASREDASRFLAQASFGPNDADIDRVATQGFDAWFKAQTEAPLTRHQDRVKAYDFFLTPLVFGRYEIESSFWNAVATAPDQLRQRLMFALSEVFVISTNDMSVLRFPRGVASYMDMLAKHSLGSYRDLLEGVALHPMMGLYLSHLANRKEDPASGRIPDENFAREVMQLFSIGLYELNPDGSLKLNAQGRPIETYTNDDVMGLARVFTGWSFAAPEPDDAYFDNVLFPLKTDPNRDVLPMRPYPQHHSAAEKRFLGTTVAANTDAAASMKAALDRLAQHPNVGPFLGRQLIQKLVTSNPSPAYVARVSAVFADNGQGVRGDLAAVVRAVLLDPEARAAPSAQDTARGKLREPVMRIAAWMRAFDVKSRSGAWAYYFAEDPVNNIGQAPMRSPSVFNFFRPGYVAPNTSMAAAGLVAPEMQITGETTVASYVNVVESLTGLGGGLLFDLYSDYTAEEALADDPAALIARVNLLLAGGTMGSQTQALMREAIESVPIDSFNARENRARIAVMFAMNAPEFIVQK
jgi:uncharacterized protein (DUF1800 family)